MSAPRPEVFAEIACSTGDRLVFEREALSVIDQAVGFDVGWFAWPAGPSPVAPGLLDSVRRVCPERWEHYRRESALLMPAAADAGGVAVDREVLGVRRLERLDLYQDIQRPHGGKCTALVFLRARGKEVGRLVVGRASRERFSAVELAFLRSSVPVLSLCLESLKGYECAPALPALTPREVEILSYLPLGYSNAQIALALGTATRTVRNQLSGLFAKLGVATRAEAAALAVRQRNPEAISKPDSSVHGQLVQGGQRGSAPARRGMLRVNR